MSEHVPVSRPRPAATDRRNRVRQPLVFGGIPEAEGWALAPITPRDRVHFRVDHELPLEEFRADLPDGVTVSYDQGDGLYRVDGEPAGRRRVLADWIRGLVRRGTARAPSGCGPRPTSAAAPRATCRPTSWTTCAGTTARSASSGCSAT